MRRSYAALLLCSIALVAFAAAAQDASTNADSKAVKKPSISPEQALKILAMDSAVATSAFDKEAVPSVSTAASKKTYKRKSWKSKYSKSKHGENKPKKSHEDKDDYKSDEHDSKEDYGSEHYDGDNKNGYNGYDKPDHGEYEYKYGDKPSWEYKYGDRPSYEYNYGDMPPCGDMPPYGDKSYPMPPEYNDKPYEYKHGRDYAKYGDKPAYDKYGDKDYKYGDKPSYDKEYKYGDKPTYGDKESKYGDKPSYDKDYDKDYKHGEKDYDKEYEHKSKYGDKSSYDKEYNKDSEHKSKYGSKSKYGGHAKYGKYGSKSKYGHKSKYSYGSKRHDDSYDRYGKDKDSYGKNSYGYDSYGKDSYGHDSYDSYSDYGSYESAKKICLQEVRREPNDPVFLGPYAAPCDLEDCPSDTQNWTEVDKKHKMTEMKDTIVPDAHLVNEIMKPIEPIGYCNWTIVTTNMLAMFQGTMEKPVVGSAMAVCEITAPCDDCIPYLSVGDTFMTDNENANLTLWVQVEAALSAKHYPFAYIKSDKGDTQASVMGKDYGTKEIYSSNHEYAYEPADDTPTHYESDPHRGIVDHASAMLEAVPGKTKGGAIHYTFGFVDENGKVKCPGVDNITIANPAPEIEDGKMLPLQTCGQYHLKLWKAPSEGPYYGYDGHYHNPYEYYGYDRYGYDGYDGYNGDRYYGGEHPEYERYHGSERYYGPEHDSEYYPWEHNSEYYGGSPPYPDWEYNGPSTYPSPPPPSTYPPGYPEENDYPQQARK